MSIKVLLIHIMRIVGSNNLNIVFSRQFYKHFIHLVLFRNIMSLKFYIIIFTKYIQPPFEFFLSFIFSFFQNSARYRCSQTACSSNQARMILQNKFFIYSRIFTIQPFHIAIRTKLQKVFITFRIFCEQKLMITNILIIFRKYTFVSIFHYVKFATYNRFYFIGVFWGVVLGGFCHKFENTKHISMVRNCYRRHIIIYSFLV